MILDLSFFGFYLGKESWIYFFIYEIFVFRFERMNLLLKIWMVVFLLLVMEAFLVRFLEYLLLIFFSLLFWVCMVFLIG